MYRPSRGHGQPQPQQHQAGGSPRMRRGEDPLAELARLIGQEDPFKEFDAVQPRRAPVNGSGASHAPAVAPERRAERTNGGGYSNGGTQAPRRNGRDEAFETPRQPAPRYAQQQPVAAPSRAPAARAPIAPQPRSGAIRAFEDQPRPSARPNGRDSGVQVAERGYRARDPYADEYAARAPATSARSRRPEPQPADRYVPEEAPRHARSRPQQAPYQDPYQRGYENDYDPEYDDEAYLPEHADDIYDDVERSRRGFGFWLVSAIVVASLIAVAFLGVFAYRTIFNSQPRAAFVTKSPAPVKVEPKATPQTTVSPSNKPIQDRVAGTPDQTQIMRREEAPADLTQPNPQAVPPRAPEVQRPASTKNNPAFTPPQQQQQQPQLQAPQAIDQQPKRVKTIPLRADGTVQQPGPQQQNAPMPLQATPEPDTQAVPPNRPNSNVPPANRNVASLGPTPAPQQQSTANGNYIVQVASHKTQEEAQNAWSALRQQYSSIFGARNADIRRVDLGDRGTFYRAMVGPMSRDQANALCQNLKTQGAGCIVQTRN
jgi:hypothetical protein